MKELAPYQAFYIQETKSYLVCLPAGKYLYGDDEIYVHGNKETFEVKDFCRLKVEQPIKHVIEYVSNDGASLPPSVYLSEVTRLRSPLECDEDTDEYCWPTLEDEYAYRKFIETWFPKYEDSVQVKPVEIEVFNQVLDTGDKYTTPLFKLNGSGSLYSFNRERYMYDLIAEEAKRGGVRFENANHTFLSYAKIEGKYVFNGQKYKVEPSPFIGTLEMVEEEKAVIQATFGREVRAFINKQNRKYDLEAFPVEIDELVARASAELAKVSVANKYRGSLNVTKCLLIDAKELLTKFFEGKS